MSFSSRLVHGLCGVVIASSSAAAGGFSTARFGGERGHAATDNLTAIYYNPAGLAFGKGTRGLIEGMFALRTVDYDRDPGAIDNPGTNTPDEATSANAGPAHLTNFIASPFLGFATDAGVKGLGIGVGVYVPFGGQASWDQNDAYEGNTTYPGAVDGPQRWSAIEGEQRSLYATLAVAYRHASGKFGMGVGFNLVQNTVSLVRARNANGTDDLVVGGAIAEGRSLLEVDNLEPAASIGVMVKPTPCSRIGLSYQSQPNFGESRLSGTLTNKFGQTAPAATEVELTQSLPDVIRLGFEWRAFTRGSIHIGADYQRWSSYDNQCIIAGASAGAKCAINADGSSSEAGVILNLPRRWKDTYGVRAGGRWFPTDTLEVNGGVSFDSNAVPDDTIDPSLFDMNKVIGQAGVAWTHASVNLSLSLAHVYYIERTTAPRAGGVDPAPPSRNPDMAGTYASQVTFAILGVGVAM